MMLDLLAFVDLLIALPLFVSFASSGLFLWLCQHGGLPKPPTALRVFHETKPFYPSAVSCMTLVPCLTGRVIVIIVAGTLAALAIALWRLFRDVGDDDDDRWRRRKEKLVAKVSRLGSRLVTVPRPA